MTLSRKLSGSGKRKRRKLLNESFSSHLFEYCHQGLLFHFFDSIDLASYPTVVVEGKYRDMRFSCRIHFYHRYYRNALPIVLTTCNQTLFPLNKIESTCFPPSKFSFSLLQSPTCQRMQCQSIKNRLKDLKDVLFQERQALFQEIMMSYCLRCHDSS